MGLSARALIEEIIFCSAFRAHVIRPSVLYVHVDWYTAPYAHTITQVNANNFY